MSVRRLDVLECFPLDALLKQCSPMIIKLKLSFNAHMRIKRHIFILSRSSPYSTYIYPFKKKFEVCSFAHVRNKMKRNRGARGRRVWGSAGMRGGSKTQKHAWDNAGPNPQRGLRSSNFFHRQNMKSPSGQRAPRKICIWTQNRFLVKCAAWTAYPRSDFFSGHHPPADATEDGEERVRSPQCLKDRF